MVFNKKAHNKEYRLANKEKIAIQCKEYHFANKEFFQLSAYIRHNFGVSITKSMFENNPINYELFLNRLRNKLTEQD